MRDSLSCSVELRHFGVWRSAVGLIALAAAAALLAWLVQGRDVLPVYAPGVAAALALMVAGSALSLGRVEPGMLRRQGGRWSFTPASTAAPVEEGALAVAIDLGSFLLLTLARRLPSGRTARRWLPVQRQGLEAEWHALRCAVHAPAPAVDLATSQPE